MSSCAWRNVLAGALVAAMVAGCGSQPADKAETKTTETAVPQAGPKAYSVAELPALNDPLPPLDDGRVENMASAAGWERLPRDNAHLARFVLQGNLANDLPRLLVTVEDAGADLPSTVTADNVDAFAEQIQAGLSKTQEPAKALQLGDNFYARYVVGARKGNRAVDRQVLVTVQNGRRYAFTLEVYSDQILEYRDAAYATAAGVKYLSGASPSSPAEPAPEPSDSAAPPDAASE